jgi:hypothetical protein
MEGVEEQRIMMESVGVQMEEKKFDKNGLKVARSQAELIRTRNSNVILFLAVMQTTTNILVAFKVFGVIG